VTEVQIELCGRLADQIGRYISVPLPDGGLAVEQLLAAVATGFPLLAAPLTSGRVRACVNDVIVSLNHVVQPQDEVALFPPVSGG
jgi:molybdopterin converting factor small subunit